MLFVYICLQFFTFHIFKCYDTFLNFSTGKYIYFDVNHPTLLHEIHETSTTDLLDRINGSRIFVSLIYKDNLTKFFFIFKLCKLNYIWRHKKYYTVSKNAVNLTQMYDQRWAQIFFVFCLAITIFQKDPCITITFRNTRKYDKLRICPRLDLYRIH